MKPPHDHDHESPSPPHQYPQAIQLKLYQAFIFSIPILFSIILFLLFYLFYLKRRASTLISSAAAQNPPNILPRTALDAAAASADCESDLKNEGKDKLCEILYDECMKARDSLCCVCLGEFEVKEELLQVPACKHIFHVDCIRHWLHNHSTCPLCRAPVAVASDDSSKLRLPGAPTHHHHLPLPPLQDQRIIIVTSEGSTSAA